MHLAPARFPVTNTAAQPLALLHHTVDPLRCANGTLAPGALTLEAERSEPLDPGESTQLALTGAIPARAGTYTTAIRLLAGSGETTTIPVALEIPAASGWGILCMLFGLVLLGTVNLLQGEGDIRTRLHDALQARQDIHTTLEANPAPQSRAPDVALMDHDFDRAIGILSRRRQPSVVDHRAAEAQPYLDEATRTAARLRADLAGLPRGAAEIEDVRRDWTALQTTLQQIAAFPQTPPAPNQQGFEARLDAFLSNFRNRALRDPAALVVAEMSTEFGRMELEKTAGEGDAARDLALNTRVWLQRSALFLQRALTLYRTALIQAGWMLNTDRVLRARVAKDDLLADDRAAILANLDQAEAKLAGTASYEDFRDANRLIDAAWTAQVRGSANVAKIKVDQAIAAANTQTDYADVTDLMAKLQAEPPPHTLATKQAGLTRILALWRTHVASVTDAPMRETMQHQLDSMQMLLEAGKLMDASAGYRAFIDNWTKWNGKLVDQALDQIDHPRCLEYFADLQRDAARIEATLRELPASPQLIAWDRSLDQIRLDLLRHGPDAETVSSGCMGPLIEIGRHAVALSGDLFTAGLIDVALPAATRLRLAQESGVASAVAMTGANMTRPRALVIQPRTPVNERVVGRDLIFDLTGADPVWGSSTTIRVDYGDGSAAFSADAEAVRRGRPIVHEYSAPTTAQVSATATEDPKPGEATGTLLGQGNTTVLVLPSPITGARIVADEFLNLRFALALLIAMTVYYWRYHSRTTVFGARGYDYVEAFALGFVVDAAVSHLPQAIAGLVS